MKLKVRISYECKDAKTACELYKIIDDILEYHELGLYFANKGDTETFDDLTQMMHLKIHKLYRLFDLGKITKG